MLNALGLGALGALGGALGVGGGSGLTGIPSQGAVSQAEVDALKERAEKSARECRLLKRSLDELEQRVDVEKQTVLAKEESIKRLMDILQGKGRLCTRLATPGPGFPLPATRIPLARRPDSPCPSPGFPLPAS